MVPLPGLASYFASRNTELHGYQLQDSESIEKVPALGR